MPTELAKRRRRALTTAALVGVSALLWAASGSAQYSYDPSNPDEANKGWVYFGSAKDETGTLVPDVVVRLEIDQNDYIFLTDKQGRFRAKLPVQTTPSNVIAGCSKSGFQSVQVTKRPGPKSSRAALQVDCVLRHDTRG